MLHFPAWKTTFIALTIVAGMFCAAPNMFSAQLLQSFPAFIPKNQLVLGLDLQGGSHFLIQVERDGIVNDRMENLRGDIRNSLREQRIGYTGLAINGQTVSVRIRDTSEVEAARLALNELTESSGLLTFTGTATQEVSLSEDEGGIFRLTISDDALDERVRAAVTQTIEILNRRVNELGTTEPTIQREGADRVLVQVPGLEDTERFKAILSQTARLSFRFVDTSMSVNDALNGRPPVTSEILYSNETDPPEPFLIERQIIVSGEDLTDAQPGFEQQTNEPIVTFRFNTRGATAFGRATQQNVGRIFAIILDDEVVSAPRINEPILGGSGQILGSFTPETANDLAVLLRAGALPADLTIIEERTVGPGLGADSIAAGEVATVIGAVAVIVFMVATYGLFGVISNIALAVNLILIIGVLSLLQATLTLPGIAGIVLTVGMAVDANVLIFERIREEARNGRSTIMAIDAGYSRALGTILDANITTLIAAIILFSLGSGPIRGFAVTLAIGIVTTVFSAFTFSRLLVAFWVRWRRPAELPI